MEEDFYLGFSSSEQSISSNKNMLFDNYNDDNNNSDNNNNNDNNNNKNDSDNNNNNDNNNNKNDSDNNNNNDNNNNKNDSDNNINNIINSTNIDNINTFYDNYLNVLSQYYDNKVINIESITCLIDQLNNKILYVDKSPILSYNKDVNYFYVSSSFQILTKELSNSDIIVNNKHSFMLNIRELANYLWGSIIKTNNCNALELNLSLYKYSTYLKGAIAYIHHNGIVTLVNKGNPSDSFNIMNYILSVIQYGYYNLQLDSLDINLPIYDLTKRNERVKVSKGWLYYKCNNTKHVTTSVLSLDTLRNFIASMTIHNPPIININKKTYQPVIQLINEINVNTGHKIVFSVHFNSINVNNSVTSNSEEYIHFNIEVYHTGNIRITGSYSVITDYHLLHQYIIIFILNPILTVSKYNT